MIKVEIICPVHGSYFQTPNAHINGKYGCKRCYDARRASKKQPRTGVKSVRSNTLDFINKAISKHGTKFTYDKVQYTTAANNVLIGCKVHGYFQQTPNNHLNGQGCRKCADSVRRGGYSMEYFSVYPEKKNTPALLYLIKFQDVVETFLKIGITQQDIKSRFKYHNVSYHIDPIETKSGSLFNLYQLEQTILRELNQHRYIPAQQLSGYTECLVYSESVIDLVRDFFLL
jgi:hypothetical protein